MATRNVFLFELTRVRYAVTLLLAVCACVFRVSNDCKSGGVKLKES